MTKQISDDVAARVREVLVQRRPTTWTATANAVLAALAAVPDNGGLTCGELAKVLGFGPGTAEAQIRKLAAAGEVVSTEKIRVSHSYSRVWRLP